MRSFIICVLFGAVLVTARPDMPAELIKIMEETAAICQPKTGISTDEMMGLMQKNPPSSREGYCFMACMKKEIGCMNTDNTLNLPKMMDMAQPFKAKDPQLFDTIMEVAKQCDASVPSSVRLDECETIKKLLECFHVKATEMGLTNIPLFGH